MKKVVLVGCILVAVMSGAMAQDTLKIQPYAIEKEEHLDEIDVRELPEIIKQELSSQDYSSWILQRAYKVPTDNKSETIENDSIDYILELRKDNDTIRVRFDNVGNKKENAEDPE